MKESGWVSCVLYIVLILRMDRLEIMNTPGKPVVIRRGIILLVMGIVGGLFIILIIRLAGGMV